MQNNNNNSNDEVKDASKMIALLISELDKPNGLYTWLLRFGPDVSLTRYVMLSTTFCKEKRTLPDILPNVLQKLDATQENLQSLHRLWCCFWNTYERIQDDDLWKDSVECHPFLVHLNHTTKPGIRFVTTAWNIVIKIRNHKNNSTLLDPWVLSMAAFSILLQAMKSHEASFQQWELLCTMRFRTSVETYLLGKLYQSRSRCGECPLDPPPELRVNMVTALVAKTMATQISGKTIIPLAQRIVQWLQTHEKNTENVNPSILMLEYAKFLNKGGGLNPFVFLAKPEETVEETKKKSPVAQTSAKKSTEVAAVMDAKTNNAEEETPSPLVVLVAQESQEPAKMSAEASAANDPPAESQETSSTEDTDERPTDSASPSQSEPPKEQASSISQAQEQDSSDEERYHDVAMHDDSADEAPVEDADGDIVKNNETGDDVSMKDADDKDETPVSVETTQQSDAQVEGASELIALLITEVDKPNGLYTWLLRFGEYYCLTDFVAPLEDSSPDLMDKLVETQKNLHSLHGLWCCFWNTFDRVRDDHIWNEAVEPHPFLTGPDQTASSGTNFVTVAWNIVIKIRDKKPDTEPLDVEFGSVLVAAESHGESSGEVSPMGLVMYNAVWRVDRFVSDRKTVSKHPSLLGSSSRPSPGIIADAISSLVKAIVKTQVHTATGTNGTPGMTLADNVTGWLQQRETTTGNLDPTVLMTEYTKFLKSLKGLNPFVFLAKPADNLLPKGSTIYNNPSTGMGSPVQPLLVVARKAQEPANAIRNISVVPVVAGNPPASQETATSEISNDRQGSPEKHSQSQEQDSSDEGTTPDVVLNDEGEDDDNSMQQHDENQDANNNKRPAASDSEKKPDEAKKRKVNIDTSRSRRLATAMALIVKELNSINQELPDAAEPQRLSDSMELTEWTVSLLIVDQVAPCKKLQRYLNDASPQSWTKELIPTLNRTLLRFSQENLVDKTTRTAPVSVSKSDGAVQIHGNVTDDKLMTKAVILLFYHALEAILTSESERLNVTSHPQIVLYSVFHKALLACCMWCVTKAIGVTQKLRSSPCLQALSIQTTLRVCDSNPYDFLKVSESFVRVLCLGSSDLNLGSPLPQKLPRLLQRDLQSMEVVILDSLLWSTSILNGTAGSMPEQIEDFMSKNNEEVTLWPPEILAPTLREEVSEDRLELQVVSDPEHDDFAEYRCVNFLIRSVVKLSFSRFEDICGLLRVPVECPVVTQAWVAFRHLLRHHVELLFDRHVDQWILCCLYGVAKALYYPLSFAQIIEAYIKSRGPVVGDVTCQHILRYIRMDNTSHDLATGDIIALYNRVWVPTMKSYLAERNSIHESAKKVQEMLRKKQ